MLFGRAEELKLLDDAWSEDVRYMTNQDVAVPDGGRPETGQYSRAHVHHALQLESTATAVGGVAYTGLRPSPRTA